MKGDFKGNPRQQKHDGPKVERARRPAPGPIDDLVLRNYLADSLPPEEMARVEKALRDSSELRAQLEDVRSNREDFQLHTLGSIWHRSQLTCATRQQLGSYLLDALDPELAAYIKFHMDVVECPYCRANFADLERSQSESSSPSTRGRRDRIFKVVQDLIGEDRKEN
jgi:hypothetical protein